VIAPAVGASSASRREVAARARAEGVSALTCATHYTPRRAAVRANWRIVSYFAVVQEGGKRNNP